MIICSRNIFNKTSNTLILMEKSSFTTHGQRESIREFTHVFFSFFLCNLKMCLSTGMTIWVDILYFFRIRHLPQTTISLLLTVVEEKSTWLTVCLLFHNFHNFFRFPTFFSRHLPPILKFYSFYRLKFLLQKSDSLIYLFIYLFIYFCCTTSSYQSNPPTCFFIDSNKNIQLYELFYGREPPFKTFFQNLDTGCF